MLKTVLFQTIQFSINTQFSSIWSIDRTLLGTTTPGQSEPWSDGNKGVLDIPQSSSITGTSPSNCLVSYPEHSLVGCLTLIQKSSWCILQPQPTGQLWFRRKSTILKLIIKIIFKILQCVLFPVFQRMYFCFNLTKFWL